MCGRPGSRAVGFERQGRRGGPTYDVLGKGNQPAVRVVAKLVKNDTGRHAVVFRSGDSSVDPSQSCHDSPATRCMTRAVPSAQRLCSVGILRLGNRKAMVLGVAVALGALGVAWSRTVGEMWLRWYPFWGLSELGLIERFTRGDSYYTHGPLVPVASLLIAYLIYCRAGIPVGRSRGAGVLGWMILAACLSTHLISLYATVTFVSGYSLIGVLYGLILIWGGWPMFRTYVWPIGLLVFMVPLPMAWISDLNFHLKVQAIRMALWLTTEVFRVPAIMDGSYVYLLPGPDGQAKILIIDNVCSGLRSLISLAWFSSILVPFSRVAGCRRLVLLAASVPVAIGCNVVRITTFNIVTHCYSADVLPPGSRLHEFLGLMMFAMAIGVLLGLERLLVAFRRFPKSETTNGRFSDRPGSPVGLRMVQPTPVSIGVLVLVAIASVLCTGPAVALNTALVARRAVPTSFTINEQLFTSYDLELDQDVLSILETDDYVFRRYTGPNGRDTLYLLIVFSANSRKGTHPPDACLEAGGEQIVHKQIHRLRVGGIGELDMRELVSQNRNRHRYHLYTYWCSGRYTSSFLLQQATIFLNSLTSRHAGGALIRLTVPVENKDIAAARRLALSAATQLLPMIDRRLP